MTISIQKILEDRSFDWLFNQSSLDVMFDEAITQLSQIDEA